MSDPENPPSSLHGSQRSASAEASRQAEWERLRAMTPLERMALALELGRQMRELLELRAGPPRIS